MCKYIDETVPAHIMPSCFVTGVSREEQSAWSTGAVSRHMLNIKYGCTWEATASLEHFKAPIRATCSSKGRHHCIHMALYNVQPPPCVCTRFCTCITGGVPFEDQIRVVLLHSRRVSSSRKDGDMMPFCSWWLGLFKRIHQHTWRVVTPSRHFKQQRADGWYILRKRLHANSRGTLSAGPPGGLESVSLLTWWVY